MFTIPPSHVYHQIRTPLQERKKHAAPELNSTPSTTPPPNTPLHPFYSEPATSPLISSANPIPARRGQMVRSSSVDDVGVGAYTSAGGGAVFGMTAATKDSTCYLCKQRVSERPPKFRNVVLALNLEGISVVKPFIETVLVHYPWWVIKQWSWNPVSFIFIISHNRVNEIQIYFETPQSDEILASINYYVSLNLKQLKENKEKSES